MFVLLFCVQPLQAQTTPTVYFESSDSAHYESYSPTIFITVLLSEPSPDAVYVNYAVSGGTAINGVDFLLYPGTLMFSPGETTKDITLDMGNDLYGEDDETIIITLSDPVNAVLDEPSSHTYTIENDDFYGFEFFQSSSSGYESETTVKITVGYFSWFRSGDVTVNYQVTGGTATGGGVDYILGSGTLGITLGEDSNDIEITIINDSIVEEDETIQITLTGGDPNSIGLKSTYTYTILNDDDQEAPSVTDYFPEPNSIQVARDTFIRLELTDNLSGVDVNTVQILVEGNLIFDGNTAEPNGIYNSSFGTCRWFGTETDYVFLFLPSAWFDYEQEVNVLVYAKDKFGNTMPKESFSFYTIMRAFGQNLKVNSGTNYYEQNNPSTATDSSGNIWVVFLATIDTDIFIAKLTEGENSFGKSTAICEYTGIQNYPVLAIDSDDNLYVAWQAPDKAGGNWNIYVSKSADGTTWSTPVLVNFSDPNNDYNQTLPAIVIDHDSTDTIYIACEDDREGNKDIWVSSSTNGTTWTPIRINTNTSDQTDPAIAINNHVIYLGWTDARNASTDIYGTTSNNAWAEEEWVVTSSNQSSLALASDPNEDGVVHKFWVDDAGGYYDIYYRVEDTNSTGVSITDEDNIDKKQPAAGVAIANGTSVPFVAWKDWRNVTSNNDTDIYYSEKTSTGFGTNILVNDDIGTSPQSSPAVGIDLSGNPYIVWADKRKSNGNYDIYYTGVTSFGDPLSKTYISDSTSVIVQTPNKVEITIPDYSMPYGFNYSDISISKLINPPALPDNAFGVCYNFSPSGLTFSKPVTITIPHDADYSHPDLLKVYWYNAEIGTWSQEGISNEQHHIIDSSTHTVSFQTTHFTSFVVGSDAGNYGGGGGGGCAMSKYSSNSSSYESIFGYFLPYVVYVLILLTMNRSYKRKGKAKNDN
jgi:hypothetical protein